ncbi:hypothetical protein JTE90_002601 [Oedothorax gibbosus]|uniref:Calmodulin-binding domain-containing protein n=1 Tax=Oedothorax gibbosus TaxID=931172 RepID=A0AAV6V440_9ARAC|nr:hypothetical protein JTE90_002601 [Oedothorax gibbosus]
MILIAGNFILPNLKNAAASVLRETWLIYKHTKLVKNICPGKVRLHQRKFLLAIYTLRKVKLEQRKLMDNANTISDMAKTSNSIYEIVGELSQRQLALEDRIQSATERIAAIQETLDSLPDLIACRILAARKPSVFHQPPGSGPSWASISSVNLPAAQRRGSCTLGVPTIVPSLWYLGELWFEKCYISKDKSVSLPPASRQRALVGQHLVGQPASGTNEGKLYLRRCPPSCPGPDRQTTSLVIVLI